jgi:transcriptional regulator with XRE-family HTH domain
MSPHEYNLELTRCFGENILIARRRADLSQEELGFLASLHRTEIGQLERGIRLPRIDTVVKLAGALSVPPGLDCPRCGLEQRPRRSSAIRR